MKPEEQQRILRLLDAERQILIYPGVTRFADTGVIRDVSADGGNCEIVYSSCSAGEVDGIIRGQVQVARSARYELEWKVYGHDQPGCLGERLVAAGFEAGARETFMVFFANDASRDAFGAASADIRRVTDRDGLRDYQIIREEVSGRSCTREVERHAS
ncbi:MAG: hypothetical protein H7145_14540, partial [Akkermansiaceae bacterium]|nr:hypothetical protein [Armatimonadota bacterium]